MQRTLSRFGLALFALLALFLTREQPGPGLDLLVYGGTPQGVAAAASAASRGLSVLLVVPQAQLGGVLTNAWLTTLDSSVDGRGTLLNQGSFTRLLAGLGWDPSFDLKVAQRVLTSMTRQGGLTVWSDAQLKGLSVKRGVVQALSVAYAGRTTVVTPRTIIDASDNADLAGRAGARFTLGRSDTGLDDKQMAATLVFRMTGVAWTDVQRAIEAEMHRGHGMSDVHGRSANGLWDLARGYPPSDPSRYHLRGLNLARQDDGSVLVNALLIAGVDGTDPRATAQARRGAVAEARRVVSYLKTVAPGVFGGARYGGAAPDLYLRETRHLLGVTRLHAVDLFYGQDVPDPVAQGGYPLDGQIYDARESTYLLGRPLPYQVSFGSLIPRGLQNVLVVSQAASFDSPAAFSARVVPLQMALGDAAGTAAWVAIRRDLGFGVLDRHFGLLASALPRPVRFAPLLRHSLKTSDGAARALLNRGLINLPYYIQGNFDLQGPVSAPEVLADLEHWLYSRALSPLQQQVLSALHPLAQRAALRPMRGEELRSWLAELTLPPQPYVLDGTLNRAMLIRVLGQLTHTPPLPDSAR